MSNLPTAAEIAELIDFCREELSDRAFSGYPEPPARSALAIAERLPALVAEVKRLTTRAAELRGLYETAVSNRNYYADERKKAEAEIARLTKERDDARDYAFEATKTITGLTVGGSEFFAGKLGDRYKADLPFCEKHIRERLSRGYDLVARVIRERKVAEASLARLSRENAAMREAATVPTVATAEAIPEMIAGLAGEAVAAQAYPFKWWVSIDGETYFQQFDTREEAVECALGYGGATIAECKQADFDLRIDDGDIYAILEERNEEAIGEGEFIEWTREQGDELTREVNAVIAAWAKRHNIKGTAWTFAAVRNEEKIVMPAEEKTDA